MTLTEDAPGAGLWLCRDNGKTWRAFDELPFSNIQRVEFDPTNDADPAPDDLRRQRVARTGQGPDCRRRREEAQLGRNSG